MTAENFHLKERNIRVAISPSCNLNCVYCDSEQSRCEKRPGAMEDFRHKPISEGIINTDQNVELIRSMVKVGFVGMSLTGGEPMLNKEWDLIVDRSKDVGMKRVGVTTNGMLLERYVQSNKSVPEGLDLLTISLDTTNSQRFKEITRGGKLDILFNGLKEAKSLKPQLPVRVNKVVLKSDLLSLPDYVGDCEQSGVVDEIKLLNLVLKDPKNNSSFFEREFATTDEIKQVLDDAHFDINVKNDFQATLPSGLKVMLMDTNPTMRSEVCQNCPAYCQEGFFTARIATDGSVSLCPDYYSQLPYIDGARELEIGNLDGKVMEMTSVFDNLVLQNTLQEFCRRHGVSVVA